MNENCLNYYSRNSPKKPKKQPQPGVLIPSFHPTYSAQNTARSRFSSLSDRIHPFSETHEIKQHNEQQILIMEEEPNFALNNEILIVEGQYQQGCDHGQNSIPQQQNQSSSHHSQRHQEPSNIMIMDEGSEHQEQQQLHHQSEQNTQNQIHQQKPEKQIFRVFSFGNQNQMLKDKFQEEEHEQISTKQPLIRRLFSDDQLFSPKKGNQLTDSNKPKENQGSRKFYKKNLTSRSRKSSTHQKQEMEDWQKLMIYFISKRSKKSKSDISESNEFIKEELQPEQIHHSQPQIEQNVKEQSSNHQQNYHQSQNSQSEQIEKSAIENGQSEREKSIKSLTSKKTSIKNQQLQRKQEEVYQKPTENQLIEAEMVESITFKEKGQKNRQILIQDEEEVPYFNTKEKKESYFDRFFIQLSDHGKIQEKDIFNNSTILLLQAIKTLPESLIPVYLKIYNQLIIQQVQTHKKFIRQEGILGMMQMLIQLHKRLVCVDSYVVKDFQNKKQQQIMANQQIIMSLIRILARR